MDTPTSSSGAPTPTSSADNPASEASAAISPIEKQHFKSRISELKKRFESKQDVLERILEEVLGKGVRILGPHLRHDAWVAVVADYYHSIQAYDHAMDELEDLYDYVTNRHGETPIVHGKCLQIEGKAQVALAKADAYQKMMDHWAIAIENEYAIAPFDQSSLEEERADFDAEQRKALAEVVAVLDTKCLNFNKEKQAVNDQKRSAMPATTDNPTRATSREVLCNLEHAVVEGTTKMSLAELRLTPLQVIEVEHIPDAVEVLLSRAIEETSSGKTQMRFDTLLESILGKIDISSMAHAAQVLTSRLGSAYDAVVREGDALRGEQPHLLSSSPPTHPPHEPAIERPRIPEVGLTERDGAASESQERHRSPRKRPISYEGESLLQNLPGLGQSRSRPAINRHFSKQSSVKSDRPELGSLLQQHQIPVSFLQQVPPSLRAVEDRDLERYEGMESGQSSDPARTRDFFHGLIRKHHPGFAHVLDSPATEETPSEIIRRGFRRCSTTTKSFRSRSSVTDPRPRGDDPQR